MQKFTGLIPQGLSEYRIDHYIQDGGVICQVFDEDGLEILIRKQTKYGTTTLFMPLGAKYGWTYVLIG